jgi:hypothetical protein
VSECVSEWGGLPGHMFFGILFVREVVVRVPPPHARGPVSE